MIRANDDRRHNAHVIVFFIFLVANAGGCADALGDPPLFLGFLKGIDFFWPTVHTARPDAGDRGACCWRAFSCSTAGFYAREGRSPPDLTTPDRSVSVAGGINFLLVPAIIGAILLSASLELGEVTIFGTSVAIASMARDAAFIAIAMLSIAYTPSLGHRAERQFRLEPIKEVAELFAGIFITIIPVLPC